MKGRKLKEHTDERIRVGHRQERSKKRTPPKSSNVCLYRVRHMEVRLETRVVSNTGIGCRSTLCPNPTLRNSNVTDQRCNGHFGIKGILTCYYTSLKQCKFTHSPADVLYPGCTKRASRLRSHGNQGCNCVCKAARALT